MRISTTGNTWTVFASWLGATRAVFSGTLFECIEYKIQIEGN